MINYIFVCLIVFIYFFRSLYGGYSVDDNWFENNLKWFRDGGHKDTKLKDKLHIIFFAAGYFKTAFKDHLFTMSLFMLLSCLVYKVSGSMLATIFYILCPVNNQIAIWMNGRRYLVSAICALASMVFPPMFFMLYPFAVWLHVSSVPLPLMMALKGHWVYLIIGIAFFFLFGYKRIKERFISRKSEFSEGNEIQALKPRKVIILIKRLGFYFFHTILPNKPRMFHEHQYYYGRYEAENKRAYSLDFDFWKGAVVVLYVSWEIIFNQNFWAFWWLAFILPWCGIAQVTMNVADRYCSLAGVGLISLFTQRISLLPSPFAESIIVGVLVFYVVRYEPLFRAYSSIDNFYWYHIAIQPDGVEARICLSKKYLEKRDPFSAFALVKEGLRYRPRDFKLLLQQATVMFAMGHREQGVKILEISKKYVPLGEEKIAEDEIDKIIKDERIAAKITPDKIIYVPQNRQQRRFLERKNKQ